MKDLTPGLHEQMKDLTPVTPVTPTSDPTKSIVITPLQELDPIRLHQVNAAVLLRDAT